MTGPLNGLVPSFYRPPVVDDIERAARAFGIPAADIRGSARHFKICRARWAAMLLMRRRGLSTTQIGNKIGKRDHTTVMHGLKRAEELMATDRDFALCMVKMVAL
jgi:chromosomal replication initiator protein